MRRIINTLSAMLAGFAALASPVDKSTAENVAKAFFNSSSTSMAWCEEGTKSIINFSPAYYVFNNTGGGWIIVAGDNCCEPVLAYSLNGSISADNLPENFKAWMSGISRNVNLVRKAALPARKAASSKWQSIGRTKAGVVTQKLIETASWDQESPYNDQCPTDGWQRSITGCVATAMAIVLRHNCYPEKGSGTIPSYTTDTKNINVPEITLGAEYDWEKMPLEYDSSSTTEQRKAVAELMYHCGAMVYMDYTKDFSAAYSSNIIPALSKFMGYSKAARELYRYNYSNNDWLSIIRDEIDADRPIIYGGSDSETNDGHQFVLDGYDSECYVHINWGWSGVCNAWYAVNYLGDKSEYGVNDVFSYYDSAIIGLVPDEGGTSTTNVELCLESQSDDSIYGLSFGSGSIVKGYTFQLLVGYICNYDEYSSYNGALRIALYTHDGTLKEIVSDDIELSLDKASVSGSYITPGYTYKYVTCGIKSDICVGDYLMANYKLSDGSWACLGGYHSDEFSGDQFYTNYKICASGQAYMNIPADISGGAVIYPEIVSSLKLPSSVDWYWDGVKNSSGYIKVTSGSHTLKAVITYTDNSKETLHKTIKTK